MPTYTPAPDEKINVRNIISLFENQSSTNYRNEISALKRTKSMGNVDTSKHVPSPKIWQHGKFTTQKAPEIDIVLEKRINRLKHALTKYESYSKQNHMQFSNEIIALLLEVLASRNVASKTQNELVDLLKHTNEELNAKLPGSTADSQPEIVLNETQENSDETDAPSVAASVQKLKQLFEQKKNEREGLNELLSKKSKMNGSNPELKYKSFWDKQKPIEGGVVHSAEIVRHNSHVGSDDDDNQNHSDYDESESDETLKPANSNNGYGSDRESQTSDDENR